MAICRLCAIAERHGDSEWMHFIYCLKDVCGAIDVLLPHSRLKSEWHGLPCLVAHNDGLAAMTIRAWIVNTPPEPAGKPLQGESGLFTGVPYHHSCRQRPKGENDDQPQRRCSRRG